MAKKKNNKKKKNSDLITSNAKTVTAKDPGAYKSTAVAPAEYQSTAVAPAAYVPGVYASEYGDQLNAALDKVTNWNYDPLQDAAYNALAKVYTARGNLAAKNSLADAAALNGGYGTSYAVSAAQQSRNQYNQELASLIPDLENAAYNRATGTLSALREADNTAYGRFRDTEGDKQWQYEQAYQKYRDTESDNQWKYTQNYQRYRDQEADNQFRYNADLDRYQWGQNYNYQIARDLVSDKQWAKEYALSKKGSSGGGGGGGRRSGGGGGGYSSTGSSSNGSSNIDAAWIKAQAEANPNIQAAQEKGKKLTDYYKNQKKTSGGGSGKRVAMTR
jgi:uncharacterized membrane protein YgcG